MHFNIKKKPTKLTIWERKREKEEKEALLLGKRQHRRAGLRFAEGRADRWRRGQKGWACPFPQPERICQSLRSRLFHPLFHQEFWSGGWATVHPTVRGILYLMCSKAPKSKEAPLPSVRIAGALFFALEAFWLSKPRNYTIIKYSNLFCVIIHT